MNSVHDQIRQHLLDRCGFNGPLAQARTNWSNEFAILMRNRLAIGHIRYGNMHDPAMRGRYNNVGSAIERLQAYLDDGNKEHLVDAANLAMFEFEIESCHPSPELRSVDDGLHTSVLNGAPSCLSCGERNVCEYVGVTFQCEICRRQVPWCMGGDENGAAGLCTDCVYGPAGVE